MNANDLARRIVVRHREAGHLRLELPAEICHAAAGTALEAALREVAGVHRVVFQATERRLAVHFEARLCNAADVARALRASLGALPPAPDAGGEAASQAPASDSLAAAPQALRDVAAQARQLLGQARRRIEALRQPDAEPGSLQARLQPILATALTEEAAINFLNDLVAFYLVRVHWDLISQRWLKNPVKHADAWLTVFYLMFLLVRYRKSIAAQPVAAQPEGPAAP